MNITAVKPLNDAFKLSQPLPQLPGTESSSDDKTQSAQPSKPSADAAKQSRAVENPWASIRRSFIRSLAFDAAFCLLVVAFLFPGSRAGINTRPEAPPGTAARANPWHNNHRPWNTFPTHHLPAPPADHSIRI
jgi:hypothetical protein